MSDTENLRILFVEAHKTLSSLQKKLPSSKPWRLGTSRGDMLQDSRSLDLNKCKELEGLAEELKDKLINIRILVDRLL